MLRSNWQKLLVIFLIPIIFILSGCALALPFGNNEETLTIRALNVGQGDAFLLEKGGEWILIDSGDADHREDITAYLKNYGAEKISKVIISHPHADHLGGMYAVFRTSDVKQVYDTGIGAGPYSYRMYRKDLEERHIPLYHVKAGDRISLFDEVVFEVAGPVSLIRNEKGAPDLNNNSIVGRLRYNDFTMLFTGDAEKEEEMDILKSGVSVKSDILKVGHHGSRTSSSAQFLRAVDPEAAVISAGPGNSYGLPHNITLRKLEYLKVPVYRTDRDGTITITTDGNGYNIEKSL